MPPKVKKLTKKEEEDLKKQQEEEERLRKEKEDEEKGIEPEIPDDVKSLAWRVIGPRAFAKLDALTKPEEVLAFVATKLNMEDYEDNEYSCTMVDHITAAILHARECGFSSEQTSTFITMMKRMVEAAGEGMSKEDLAGLMKKMILNHSIDKPPENVLIFNTHSAKMCMDFAVKGVLRYHRLYSYTFGKGDRGTTTIKKRLFMHTALPPPPLNEMTRVDVREEKSNGDQANEEAKDSAEKHPLEQNKEETAKSSSAHPDGSDSSIMAATEAALEKALPRLQREMEQKWARKVQVLENKIRSLENS